METDPHTSLQARLRAAPGMDDPTLMETIFNAYYQRVFNFLYSYTRDWHTAQDLTSQAFITAFSALPTLKDPAKLTSWLFQIARNLANDHFRKAQRHPQLELADAFLPPTPAGRPHPEESILLQQLLASLSLPDQDLLRLRLVAQLTFKEIGELIRQPEDRVKKRYYRLLGRLRRQLEDPDDHA